MIVDFTDDEITLARYALTELANRRFEQALDMHLPACREEGERMRALADRLSRRNDAAGK